MESTIHDYLLLSYREDLDVLFLRWTSPVGSTELRAGYYQALEMAERLGVRFWLYDLRSRGQAADEDEAWLLNEFFPMTEKKLGYDNAFAYLVLPMHYGHIRDHVGLERIAEFSPITRIKVFMAEREALLWLAQRQQTLQNPR